MSKEAVANILRIRKSKLNEVFKLAPHLREDDKKEVRAAGTNCFWALLNSYLHSYICKTAYVGNKVIGMWGACVYKNYCSIWFLGADESENYPITFVKEGKKLINEVFKSHSMIFNYVYTGNRSHIEYLKRIGLIVDEANPIKCPHGDFYSFYKIKGGN